MRRDVLGEELRDEKKSMEKEVYEAAEAPDYALVEEMVSTFLESEEYWSVHTPPHVFDRRFRDDFYSRLTDILDDKGFDAQVFLDSLVQAFAETASEVESMESAYLFISAVQTLYDLGYNNLTLDLRHQTHQPDHIGLNIEASQANRFSLICHLPIDPSRYRHSNIGRSAEYCRFYVTGNVSILGWESSDCEFKLEGAFDLIGLDCTNCSFYLPIIDKIEFDTESFKAGEILDDKPGIGELTLKRQNRSFKATIPYSFWKNNNSLNISDGKDNWKEVFPPE